MKTRILIILAFLFIQFSNAQLKKKYTEIHDLYPNAKSNGLRNEGSSFAEELEINNEKKKIIFYNKDSIAIGVGNFDKKTIKENVYKKIILEEIPNFKISKTAVVNSSVYYYDEKNNYLIINKPFTDQNEFPLRSFFIIIEPEIIAVWIKNINNWQ
jgi:hypothetical protein